MRYATVCSGIEAPSVAWHPLGWEPAFYSEIESFPAAVLAHHYPDTLNRGDMNAFRDWPDAAFDLLCGGTPCQSFSVAGFREGLADPRGNLALVFLAVLGRFRPAWVVWENVPGVLSSAGGRDFGTFLGALGELGYGWAYRVLDAQHFGVPQRRRRVFVVGHLGDWRRAAAVLFEPDCLSGNPPPRREAGARAAGTLTVGADQCIGRPGEGLGIVTRRDYKNGFLSGLMAPSLRAKANCSHREDMEAFVTHTLRADGFDAGEDGTGRGTPLVQVAYQCHGSNVGEMGTLRAGIGAHPPAVAFHSTQDPISGEVAPCMGQGSPQGSASIATLHRSAVRRLTPRECERLQGFPDDYTAVPYKGKPAADGPRYKALGNSMAVPVVRWIGRRIAMVEAVA